MHTVNIYIYHTSSVTDHEILQNVNWNTLSSRRQTFRLSLLYKIMHNLYIAS